METITIINSDLQEIDARMFTGNLNIKSTKQVGLLWDSPTEIRVAKNLSKRPTLNVDDASEVKIK